MSNPWFRHYVGLSRDKKIAAVAVKTKQPIDRVVWVYISMLESASEIDDGGRFEFDAAEAAYFLRADESDILAIADGLVFSGRISENVVVNWGDRQFQSDKSASRQAAYRERKRSTVSDDDVRNQTCDVTVTVGDGVVTAQDTDTDTDTEKKELTQREREGFEEFWTSYPEAGRVSWDTTEKAWLALSEKDRGRALEALPSFKTWISKQKNDYITLHAAKFLSTKRFKDHEAPTGKGTVVKSIPILKGTPEFDAWLVAKGGKLPAFPIRGEGGRLVGEGCYQQTKFPPSNEDVAA